MKKEDLVKNMGVIKYADAFSFVPVQHSVQVIDGVEKSVALSAKELLEKDELDVELIINTTNLLDSHGDVHIKGIWDEDLAKGNIRPLLKSHKSDFEFVIADEMKAVVKEYDWSELNIPLQGKTQALVFTGKIVKEDNPYMFEQYAKGKVKQHSVGMQYNEYHICVNSEDKYWREEKENWDKYIGFVANKDRAEQKGYFYAVTKAASIEGSAVVRGSNYATPTQSIKAHEERKSFFENFNFTK